MKPKMIHWLYIMVVRPIITYGSLVWWTKTKQVTAQKKLQTLQRIACLGITGAMHTTPSAAMEALLDLLPLHEQIRKEGLMSALRLDRNSTGHRGGHSEILNLIKPEFLQTPSDVMPTKFDFVLGFEVIIDSRQDSLNRIKNLKQNSVIWYTDASKTEEGTGIGIYGPKYKESVPLGEGPSVLQAETIALERCAQVCTKKGYKGAHIYINTDSQAALKNLKAYSFNSKTTWNCRQALNQVAKGNKLTLMWVPGHASIKGNEHADALAREGALTTMIGPKPTCGLSKAHRKGVVQEWEKKCKTEHWENVPGQRQSKMFIDLSTNRAKQLLRLTKTEIRLVTGLLTGHCPVKYHLHKMGKVDNTTCRLCGLAEETAEHILCECVALATTRLALTREMAITPERIRAWPPRK